MTRVALIFGGRSPEHEVSIVSARFVDQQLLRSGFETLPIGVDRQGHWHMGDQAFERLYSARSAAMAGPPGGTFPKGLDVDVIFPLIHGLGGEDGSIQGFCECMGYPYVGGDVLNMSLCWDKLTSRMVMASHGIPQLPFVSLIRSQYKQAEAVANIEERFDYPVFVKPSRTGSSIGISRAQTSGELRQAIQKAFVYDFRVLVEPGLRAREVEVSGLGSLDPFFSVPAEIVPKNAFYDFDEKYLKSATEFIIPADLPASQLQKVHRLAATAWACLNCYGMARIDFLITAEEVYLNEVNTIPGFTPISMYVRLLEESGIEPAEVVTRLVTYALERESLLATDHCFETHRNWFKEDGHD